MGVLRLVRKVIIALGILALLIVPACARRSLTEPGDQSGSAGSGGSGFGGSGSGTMRAGRSGGGMAERVPVTEFHPAHELHDVHFDFDRYDIRPQDEPALQSNAAWLRSNRNYLVLIEGHSDERGTAEYNVTLGERRAKMAQNYLVAHGIESRRISIISYGEHRPQCAQSTEECWSNNRRAHFRIKRQ